MAKIKKILHQLNLKGIGGVQQSFIPFFHKAIKDGKYLHRISGFYDIDEDYVSVQNFYTNLKKNPIAAIQFFEALISKDTIVHFYNNLESRKLSYILNFLPCCNVVLHERGRAWNVPNDRIKVYQDNVNNSDIVLVNSFAAKNMLVKRFLVSEKKIHVIYNGFISKFHEKPSFVAHDSNSRVKVGFIGRFDTPKGIHTLIDAAKLLPNCDFHIAGDGILYHALINRALNYSNIYFHGRVNTPIDFINSVDIVVVPSIREPLGNVAIEAGFCRKAVIASNVDGLSEIIEDKVSGVLIRPTCQIAENLNVVGSVPIPEYVYDPVTKDLVVPKELDSNILANEINTLANNESLRFKYGSALYDTVIDKFSIENYFSNLSRVYNGFS